MIRVKMHAAKTTLSKLVVQVEAGEEVVLLRGDIPVARLVALEPARAANLDRSPRVPGRLRGLIDFDDRVFKLRPATDVSRRGPRG